MITIFYIAYEFPPLNNGGVLRSAKFAKYLPEFNIKPIVFTLDPTDFSNIFSTFLIDDNLLNDLNSLTKIHFVKSKKFKKKNPFRNYFSITRRDTSHWEPMLEKVIFDNINKYRPSAIVVSAPPFGLINFARKIALKSSLPLIIDMRDAWTFWNMTPYRTFLHYWFTKRVENKCFDQAAAIIATSGQTLDDFLYLHPTVPKEKFHLITNGFDQTITNWQANLTKNTKFRIGYVGSFYYSPSARSQMMEVWWKKPIHQWLNYTPRKEDWLYRSPQFLFKAIAIMLEEYPDLRNRIEIHFAGHKPEWFDHMVRENNLSDIVDHIGVISLSNSQKFQKTCDALLLTSAKIIGGKDYSIAGKTFEYLSLQKPILSFVCEGAQKELLKKSGVAIICNPDNPIESAQKIKKLIDRDYLLKPNQEFIQLFHRKFLSEKLANIIKDATESKSNFKSQSNQRSTELHY